MAIAATVQWEVRTTATASNANGGGFKPGASGTDFSQQDAAQYNLTLVTTAGADAVLLSASAAADMVGNIAHITSGTNFTVGWYEIISVSVGVSITLDRTCATAAGAAGVVNIGGAMSLGSSDDAFFESVEPGNVINVKVGSYTIGGAINIAKNGTSALPITIDGYNASRGDNPQGANRPTFVGGAVSLLWGQVWILKNLITTSTESLGNNLGLGCILFNSKATNTSGTAGRNAVSGGQASRIINVEVVSDNGNGISGLGAGDKVIGCYAHDCGQIGIDMGAQNDTAAINNIVDTCPTAIQTGSAGQRQTVYGNTLYGGATPGSPGVDGIKLLATTAIYTMIAGNIISGFTTGINSAAQVDVSFIDFNNFHNNTTNRTNAAVGDNDTALDPQFTDAPNGNFAVGANMKAIGFPTIFPGALSTSYMDMGAVQRQEPAGGSSGGARVAGAGRISGG